MITQHPSGNVVLPPILRQLPFKFLCPGVVRIVWVCWLTLTLLVSGASVKAQNATVPQLSNPRVLILHAYHQGFTWTDNITRGIQGVFTQQAPEVELLFEFMDVKRLYSEIYLRQLRDFYAFKYAGQKVDVIIASDDHALEFLLGHGQDFLPEVPIVFCAVNGYDPVKHRSNGRKLTGVVESIDISATLEIALKLHPDTGEVAVITDKTLTGKALKADAEEIFQQYEDRVRFTYLEHHTMEQLQQEVAVLPPEAIVFAFIFTRDAFGRIWSHEYNLERLASHCPVPIYSVWEFYLGHGIVGGMLTSGQAHGESAARMALRILRGESATAIPVVRQSPNRYMFDDAQLRRFGVKEARLPEGSILINEPFSVYEEYTLVIWVVILFVLILLVIVIVLIRDVILRRRTERALQESEARFRRLAENAKDMIYRMSLPDGTFEYISPAVTELSGYPPEVWYNSPQFIQQVVHPDWQNYFAEQWHKLLQGEMPPFYEYQIRHKSGDIRWINQRNVLICDDQGHPVAIEGIVTDITERKHAEEEIRQLNAELEERVRQRTAELEAVNKELKDFAYVVSHDLKAPLRGINRLADWLVKDYADTIDAKGKEMADLLISRVTRMDNLIEGILQYSRIGRLEEAHRAIDLTGLVHEVLDLLNPPEHIHIHVEPGLPVIVAEKTRLFQVFENLIHNAIKFLDKPHGEIAIRCDEQDEHWMFNVTDNGPGIAERYRERIFQIFQTLHSRDEIESTGIGLALVKKIIELYGGTIWVESEVTKGSTFFFTLPKQPVRRQEP